MLKHVGADIAHIRSSNGCTARIHYAIPVHPAAVYGVPTATSLPGYWW